MNYALPLIVIAFIAQSLLPASCGSAVEENAADTPPDTIPKLTISGPFLDAPDEEFGQEPVQKQICDSCAGLAYGHEGERLKWFMELVYNPAMNDPDVPAENKKFLEGLLAFIKRDTLDPYDAIAPDDLIRPVYRLGDTMIRICSDFKESVDGYAVYNTTLTPQEKNTQYYLFWANADGSKSCKIKDETEYRTECTNFRSNKLFIAKNGDTLLPAFCSPFHVVLEHRRDTLLDSLLEVENTCEGCHQFCGACDVQRTYAQLKGVPALWFTSDGVRDTEGAYPTRAIFININNKYMLELWRYQLDMSSCGCM